MFKLIFACLLIVFCRTACAGEPDLSFQAAARNLQDSAVALRERADERPTQGPLAASADEIYRQTVELTDRFGHTPADLPADYATVLSAYNTKVIGILARTGTDDKGAKTFAPEDVQVTRDMALDLEAANHATKEALAIAEPRSAPLVSVTVHTYANNKDFSGARIECTPRALKNTPPNLFVYEHISSPFTTRPLPPGRYVFSAWLLEKKLGELEMPIGLEGQQSQSIDFPLAAIQ
ncbi:hypothetical protein [Paraburkholderia flagellata]|uniref:hypothetical protein n=1 Tax=Paraburkholderia flagellata TaxID=2883241 RepID=UPI001F3E0328|nr:hypothetical protein [Paraburkholderia flagellata]